MPNPTAAPPTADAAAKPSKPTSKVRRLPMMSDNRPPMSSSAPKASEYAVTIHWRLSVPKPSALCADGSAMFTIVVSSTTMSWARPMISRTRAG